MRASLTTEARATHDDSCRVTWSKGTGLIYSCTTTCAVTALGNGDTVRGINAKAQACYVYCQKLDKRKVRMARKKRRGWA